MGLGWQSTKATEPGAVTEIVRLDQNGLGYETVTYVRWALFLEHFMKLAFLRTLHQVGGRIA